MTFGSICSGIEAASVAWHSLGWKTAWVSEIEPFCSALLKHHYPSTNNYGDFTTITADAPRIDVLVGGTPCQSFSVAGLRGGLDDDRGNLALEFCRLVDRLRPRWFVWENVPGVLSSNGGRDFGSILGAMGELGYGTAYRVLDAQYFGVPQRRRRVFVVGYLGNWRRAAAVLFECYSLSGYPPPSRQTRESATESTYDGTVGSLCARDNKTVGNQFVDEGKVIAIKGAAIGRKPEADPQYGEVLEDGTMYTLNVSETHAICGTLSASGAGTERAAGNGNELDFLITSSTGDIALTLNAGGMGRQDFETETLICRDVASTIGERMRGQDDSCADNLVAFDKAQITSKTNRSNPQPGDPSFPLHQGEPPLIAFGVGDVSGTLRSNPGSEFRSDGSNVEAIIKHHRAVRRLTPLECERLQGFPDGYTQFQRNGKPVADGPRYKALGNSMAVPVMRWIGERIQAVDAL